MFGKSMPAYGLYVRHVDDITLDNMRFTLREADVRPAIHCEDVMRIRMTGVEAAEPAGDQPCLKLTGVRQGLVSNCFIFAKKAQPVVQADSTNVKVCSGASLGK